MTTKEQIKFGLKALTACAFALSWIHTPALAQDAPPKAAAPPATPPPTPTPTPAPAPVAAKAEQPVTTTKGAFATKPAKPTPAARWQLTYKEAKGEAHAAQASLVLVKENDLMLIALDWRLPWKDATAVTETDSSGAETELTMNSKSDGPHAELVSSKGSLTIKRPSGPVTVTYELNKNSSLLRVDKSCRKAGLKLSPTTNASSSFPGVLYCKLNPGSTSPVEIVFSTLKDAEWLGSDAFEVGGKGERYKVFSYGDASALINWHLKWGASEQPVAYQVTFPNVMAPKPSTPLPSTTFEVGLGYITGSISSGGASEPLAGIEVPLSVTYKKAESIWFVGGGYDLFLYSFSKQAAGSPTTSLLQVFGGLEQRSSAFGVREGIGLIDRSLDLPALGLSANFQAPKVSIEVFNERKNAYLSARVGYATTAAGGKYNELNANLSYTFTKPNHQKRYRAGVSLQQIQASQNDLTANGQWYTLEFAFDF